MVAAKNPSVDLRPLLIPSEKDNASIFSSRNPQTKEVTSRYLSNSSLSSSSNSSCRRFPPPLLTPGPSTLAALPQSKRSNSVDRSRPSLTLKKSQETLCTMTRSLSVSFQGELFFYQTSKAKVSSNSPNTAQKSTPERRRSLESKMENSTPWPGAISVSKSLTRSFDFSENKKDPILATFRLLHQSSILLKDKTRRVSFGGQLGLDLDSDSISSGSNYGSNEVYSVPRKTMVTARGRFWQENNNSTIKSPAVKRSLIDGTLSSPRSLASPIRSVRASLPSKVVGVPVRGMTSLLRGSCSVVNAPSIISFASEVRRAKKGESRIGEAHLLRLLDNRYLQWQWVNARVNAALMVQSLAVERNLHNAWIITSELRDSVTRRRIKLQLLTQSLKLISILKEQMTYLEEWFHMDGDHSSSLSGAIDALKASTLCLPVVDGARADLQTVRDAVSSAVDVMQAMGSSICCLLSKVERISSLISELSKIAEREQALLSQSRELSSSVASMHIKRWSLHGQILQLRCKPSPKQV